MAELTETMREFGLMPKALLLNKGIDMFVLHKLSVIAVW
jgi:hypothetical protein